jgi:tetratricopeptide (TPR) repeat protein
MPLGQLNVAVADIGVQAGSGETGASDDARRLGEWIYRELQSGFAALPLGRPLVWHDSMSFLAKRASIGAIDGATPEQRTNSARATAERLNANMLIYGLLTQAGDQAIFAPEFYVADVLAQADELVGPHQLGQPLALRLPLDPQDLRTSEYLRAELGTRIEALAWLTRALVLDTNGRHGDALAVLEQAEAQLTDWEPDQGREILHYFKGREALYLSRGDSSWLGQAEEEYSQALAINPDYARAHIGLGGVYYSMAQGLALVDRLEGEALALAIQHYEQAIAGAAAAPGSHIELKGRLGLGSAYRLLGEAYLGAGQNDLAAEALEFAIEMLEAALPEIPAQDHRLAAEAHLALGASYQQRAHVALVQGDPSAGIPLYERAAAAYAECGRQADEDLYDASTQDLKQKSCEPYRLDVIEILAGLEQ